MKKISELYAASKSPLALKLLAYILICSSIFTLVASSAQLYSYYNEDISAINARFTQIESSYIKPITNSLWVFDEAQITNLLAGITHLPDIVFAEVKANSGEYYYYGTETVQKYETTIKRKMILKTSKGVIGHLYLTASLDEVYNRLWEKGKLIVISQTLKTFIVSFLILIIIQQLLIRHLHSLANFAKSIDFNHQTSAIKLNRPNSNSPDELDNVTSALNNMKTSLLREISAQKIAEEKLQIFNAKLEGLVAERTQDLTKTNSELINTLKHLNTTQSQLIQSEKLSALSGLVVGVAHEINTPLGICITSISHLNDLNAILNDKFHSGILTRVNFANIQENLSEGRKLISINLEKTARLINNFKNVAATQSEVSKREFNMAQYLSGVLDTFYTELTEHKVKLTLSLDPSIIIYSFPGALSQIITNLISNSLIHGFSHRDEGEIRVELKYKNNMAYLSYDDNGQGMNEKNVKKIFDPFHTTNRAGGSTGLGMHIVYNIVTQVFHGSIQCESNIMNGTNFKLQLKCDNIYLNSGDA
jgi:signal transduction histidine kinase